MEWIKGLTKQLADFIQVVTGKICNFEPGLLKLQELFEEWQRSEPPYATDALIDEPDLHAFPRQPDADPGEMRMLAPGDLVDEEIGWWRFAGGL